MLPIVFGEHVQVQTGRLFVVILALIAYAFAMRAPQGISDLAVSESLATPPAANCSFMTSENDCPARPALRQGLVSRHIDRDRLYGHAKEGVFIVILTKEQRAQSRAISLRANERRASEPRERSGASGPRERACKGSE